LRFSSAALRSSGTWLSAPRRTTARLGRSMSPVTAEEQATGEGLDQIPACATAAGGESTS
jgi:hypothetical protein